MYLNHFGLEQYPFSLTPDTEFYLDYGEFKDGLDVLECALHTGEGFTKITGEVGSGKTLLCRKLLSSLDQRFVTVYIPNPSLSPKALHFTLAKELGIEHSYNIDLPSLLNIINTQLMFLHDEGMQVVLLLDEAQSLPDDTLESLRLFSNLETEKKKLLQLVLFGQPELDTRLQQDRFRQLRQRILFGHKIKPLSSTSLGVYVQHRLHVAGYRGVTLFTPHALRLLQRSSRGVPRLINVIAHKALLVAFGRGDSVISTLHVRKAIADTDGVSIQRHRQILATAFLGLLGLTPASL